MEIPSGQSTKWLSIPIIATISRLLCQELTVQNEYLRLENKILKSKIKGRMICRNCKELHGAGWSIRSRKLHSMLVGVKFKNRFEDQPLWMRKFNGKSPLSGAEKHHDFQVTSCHHFDSTDVKFDDWWKLQTLNFC